MKKWQKFLIWFLWGLAFTIVDEITIFLVAHNLLNSWRLVTVEILFMVIGWLSYYITIKLYPQKKHKRK